MKLKVYLILAVTVCVLLNSSCLKGDEVNQEVVELSDIKVEDGTKNEVIMENSDTEKRLPPVINLKEQANNTSFVDKDGSTINISFDRIGNKTETREFFNHPNIKVLIVTTSATGAIKEGIVYGHNNEKKPLPPGLIDNALSASGTDIAYKVGITTTKIVSTPTKTQPNQIYTNIPDPRRQPVYTQPLQPQNETQMTQQEQPEAVPTPNESGEQKPNVAQDKRKKDEEQ